MTPEELYRKYKGKWVRIRIDNRIVYGIIVGYYDRYYGITKPLIAAITKESNGMSWHIIDEYDHIFSNINNPLGYLYAEIDEVITFRFGRRQNE